MMNKTIELDIPADTATRVRMSIANKIVGDVIDHSITRKEAVTAIVHLIAAEIAHSTGRTKAGNDIGGI